MSEVPNENIEKAKEKKAEEKAEKAEKEEKAAEAAEAEAAEKEEEEEEEEAEAESCEQEADFKERYFYLAAELDNSRKRFEREQQNWIKYGNEKILSELICVVDDFERTLMALEGEADPDPKIKNIVTGIKMVHKQFIGVLKDNGLVAVNSLGELFDPNFHEAMAQRPEEGKRDGEVIQEYQKGYQLNGRLLRAAKVIVAKADKSDKETRESKDS